MDHVVTNNRIEGDGRPSPQELEKRIRKVRIGGTILVIVAAASLAAAMIVHTVPVAFVLLDLFVGGLMAVGMSFRRNTNFGLFEGIFFGVFIGSWGFLSDVLFPAMSGDFLMTFWPGMSAWALGLGLVALPLARFSFERKSKAIRSDLASVQRYRDSGDSRYVAQMRMSARKMGKGSLITGIVMGAVMVGFGLFAWLFMDLLVGLALAAMMSIPVALLVWTLRLRGQDVRQ